MTICADTLYRTPHPFSTARTSFAFLLRQKKQNSGPMWVHVAPWDSTVEADVEASTVEAEERS
jgi:hypothetical protein